MPSQDQPRELVDTTEPAHTARTTEPAHTARSLADLARLELSREEATQLGAQLETILGYIRSLQAVEVEGVPEYLSSEQAGSGLRADVAERDNFDSERALAGVPMLQGRLVAVPKFMD